MSRAPMLHRCLWLVSTQGCTAFEYTSRPMTSESSSGSPVVGLLTESLLWYLCVSAIKAFIRLLQMLASGFCSPRCGDGSWSNFVRPGVQRVFIMKGESSPALTVEEPRSQLGRHTPSIPAFRRREQADLYVCGQLVYLAVSGQAGLHSEAL